MITQTLTRLLASLDPSLVWIHEHTAVYAQYQDMPGTISRYQELGYIVRHKGSEVCFMEGLQASYPHRVELLPFHEDYSPHEAVAFRTYNDYIRAYNIIEKDSRFKKCSNGGDLSVAWTMYRYEEAGKTYYVQFLWRNIAIFPDLAWPEPPTTE